MGHKLDITDDVVSFASAREHAWHRLGTVVDTAMDAQTALREAHLAGWNVRKEPLEVPQIGGPALEVPGKWATVRTNPVNGRAQALGVVGDQYTPVQNEDHVDLLDTLVDMSGAHFETAGALRGGREVFVTMKLPDSLVLDGPGGEDVTDLYIAGFNSHDGTSAFQLAVTPVRVVCANMQTAALAVARSTFSIRHTAGVRASIGEARAALGLAFKYVAEFEDEARRMIERQVERDTARELLAQVFAVEDAPTERVERSRLAHVDGALAMLDSPSNAAIAGTRYGVYNAVTEYVDHGWPVRGGGVGVSAERQVRGDFARLKSSAFELLATV